MRQRVWLAALGIITASCARDATGPMTSNETDTQPSLRVEAGGAGTVYTSSNGAEANAVLVFTRQGNGQLAAAGSFPTGGRGTGAGLGSQGAVVLSDDGRWLFTVNAGSNEVTSFRVTTGGLDRIATVPSGGTRPISVTWRRGLVYVLNAGGSGNITGFRVGNGGGLTPIAGSTRPLSSGASDPAQIGFGPLGYLLVVTEKATNKITTSNVDAAGIPSAPIVNASAGQTPFGFTFDHRGRLIVSEAFGGAPNASAASSYRVNDNGTLQVVSASVPTTETAACWFVVTNDGRFAYTTNTGSGSVSGYAVDAGAHLHLLDADGRTGTTGTTPIDVALSRDSRYLYNVNAGSHSITAFAVNGGTGALTSLGALGGLPASAVGIAAQ